VKILEVKDWKYINSIFDNIPFSNFHDS
jgi:hypothetical protein